MPHFGFDQQFVDKLLKSSRFSQHVIQFACSEENLYFIPDYNPGLRRPNADVRTTRTPIQCNFKLIGWARKYEGHVIAYAQRQDVDVDVSFEMRLVIRRVAENDFCIGFMNSASNSTRVPLISENSVTYFQEAGDITVSQMFEFEFREKTMDDVFSMKIPVDQYDQYSVMYNDDVWDTTAFHEYAIISVVKDSSRFKITIQSIADDNVKVVFMYTKDQDYSHIRIHFAYAAFYTERVKVVRKDAESSGGATREYTTFKGRRYLVRKSPKSNKPYYIQTSQHGAISLAMVAKARPASK